ncbi:MAG: hypothetical protein Q8O19_01190, partial [Rectinemataceae bacterium]|nr:hypothetical protein [Rectinemataceae bacterium]
MTSISSIAVSKTTGKSPPSPLARDVANRLMPLAMMGLLLLFFVAGFTNLLDITVSVKSGMKGEYSKGERVKGTSSGKFIPVKIEQFEGRAETFRDLFVLFDLGPEVAAAS